MLTITKDVLDTLHWLRAQQLEHPHVGEFVLDNPVVILTLGLGSEIYLGLDGRVFILEWMNEEAGIHETTDLGDAAAGLVIAARRYNVPELVALLPSRPDGAIDCQSCQQMRWVTIPGLAHPLVCSRCRGLAWHQP